MFHEFAANPASILACMVTVPAAAGLLTLRRPARALTDVLADDFRPADAGFAAADDDLAKY